MITMKVENKTISLFSHFIFVFLSLSLALTLFTLSIPRISSTTPPSLSLVQSYPCLSSLRLPSLSSPLTLCIALYTNQSLPFPSPPSPPISSSSLFLFTSLSSPSFSDSQWLSVSFLPSSFSSSSSSPSITNFMIGSSAVIGVPKYFVKNYYLGGLNPADVVTDDLLALGLPLYNNTYPSSSVSNVLSSGQYNFTFSFMRPLILPDPQSDFHITNTFLPIKSSSPSSYTYPISSFPLLFSYGPFVPPTTLVLHSPSDRFGVLLSYTIGDVSMKVQYLNNDNLLNVIFIHGLMMIICVLFLLPCGWISALHFKFIGERFKQNHFYYNINNQNNNQNNNINHITSSSGNIESFDLSSPSSTSSSPLRLTFLPLLSTSLSSHWFPLHRTLMILSTLLITISFIYAIVSFDITGLLSSAHRIDDNGSSEQTTMLFQHYKMGIVYVTFIIIQGIMGMVRPKVVGQKVKEGEDEREWEKARLLRMIWYNLHKYLGRGMIILGLITSYWGISLFQMIERNNNSAFQTSTSSDTTTTATVPQMQSDQMLIAFFCLIGIWGIVGLGIAVDQCTQRLKK